MREGLGAGKAGVLRADRGPSADALWNPFKGKKNTVGFLNRHIYCLVQRAERFVSL